MGAALPTDPANLYPCQNMRTFVIFALVTLALATALQPETADEAVPETAPEMTLVEAREEFDARTEAVSTLQFLQETEGRSKNACKTLADTTIAEIDQSIRNTQNVMNRLDRGQRCHLEGKATLTNAERRKAHTEREYTVAVKHLTDARNYQVDFGRYTFSGLREGSCNVFYNDGAYRRAKANYQLRVRIESQKRGAKKSAYNAWVAARKAHIAAVKRCRCRVKNQHAREWTVANKNNASNRKAWRKAKHMLCVLSDTPESRCNTSGLRKLSKPRLSSSVLNVRCESHKRSSMTCRIASKSTNRAGVVKTPAQRGFSLTGGGMHQRLGRWDAKAQFEQAFPQGESYNCDTGFGSGSVNCYGVYCKKNNRPLQCTTRSLRFRGSGRRTVKLPGGYVMTGGGLYNHYRHFNAKAGFEDTYPSGNNGWSGDMGFGWGDYTVTVRGCKGLSCKTVSAKQADWSRASCPKGYLVTGCGVSNKYRSFNKLSSFEHVTPGATSCTCNMGFGHGKQVCYARCCK